MGSVRAAGRSDKPPVSDALALMRRVVEQDIEPDPDGGGEAYRARTVVEHKLARVDAVQGGRARDKGVRNNELDRNRAAAVINNLQEIAKPRRAASQSPRRVPSPVRTRALHTAAKPPQRHRSKFRVRTSRCQRTGDGPGARAGTPATCGRRFAPSAWPTHLFLRFNSLVGRTRTTPRRAVCGSR